MYGFWNAVFWILVYTSPGFISQAHPPEKMGMSPKSGFKSTDTGCDLNPPSVRNNITTNPRTGLYGQNWFVQFLYHSLPRSRDWIGIVLDSWRTIIRRLFWFQSVERCREREYHFFTLSLCFTFFFSFSLSLRVVLNAFYSFCLAQKYSCCCRYMNTIFS